MADAISDILSLTQAFGQFSESVVRLHDTRVKSETDARTVKINQANHDFLRRFTLKHGDPNKLTAEVDSWRPAFEAHEQQVAGYLSGIKNPRVQEAVKANLQGMNQQFALQLSNTMATAEKELVQQNESNIMAGLLDMGAYPQAVARFDEWEKKGIFDPATLQAFKEGTLKPYQAKIDVAQRLDTMQPGETIFSIMRSVSETPQEDMVDSYKGLVLRELNNVLEANNTQARDDIVNYSKKSIDAGVKGDPEVLGKIIAEYQGRVSPDVMISLQLAKIQTEGKNTEIGLQEAIAGFSTVVEGKNMTHAMGLFMQDSLKKSFGNNLQTEDAVKAYNTAQEQVKEWIKDVPAAQSKSDTQDAFMSIYQDLVTKFKAGLPNMTGGAPISQADMLEFMVTYGEQLGPTNVAKIRAELEDGKHFGPEVLQILNDKTQMEALKAIVNDRKYFSEIAGRNLKNWLDGKPRDEDRVLGSLFADVMNSTRIAIKGGVYVNEAQARTIFSENLAKAYGEFERGTFSITEKGWSDPAYHEKIGRAYQIRDTDQLSFLYPTNIYGMDYQPTMLNQVLEHAKPVAIETLNRLFPDLPDTAFTPMHVGPDLFFAVAGRPGILYGVDGTQSNGLALQVYNVKNMKAGDTLVQHLRRTGRSGVSLDTSIAPVYSLVRNTKPPLPIGTTGNQDPRLPGAQQRGAPNR